MIASLRGEVIDKTTSTVVIECGGVGYEVLATTSALENLVRGEEGFIRTVFKASEAGVVLYGFATQAERTIFTLLQNVSGLGPKLALACLNTFSPAEVAVAVTSGDSKTLQSVPGVGKRMADKMVAELKGKLDEFVSEVGAAVGAGAGGAGVGSGAGAVSAGAGVLIQALTSMGFAENDATEAVKWVEETYPDLDPSVDTGVMLKHALQYVGKR